MGESRPGGGLEHPRRVVDWVSRRPELVCGLLALVVYGLTRSRLYNIDGMGYAVYIRDSETIPFSNGSHVLYPAIGYVVGRLFDDYANRRFEVILGERFLVIEGEENAKPVVGTS